MSLFLSRCPLWLAALLVVVLPTIAAMCGPALIRRRIALERLTINNEIAGFKFATVGVIYAVLVAFAIIMVGRDSRMRRAPWRRKREPRLYSIGWRQAQTRSGRSAQNFGQLSCTRD